MFTYFKFKKGFRFVVLLCFLTMCRPSALVPEEVCQSTEQLIAEAASAKQVNINDENRRKILDLDLIDIYNDAWAIAHGVPNKKCIPEYLNLGVEFTGEIADIKSIGFLSGEGIRTSSGIHILQGRLNPLRFGELVTIPHVLNIRGMPDAAEL